MAMIETVLRCDLKKAVKVQYLDGVVFSQDNQANKISVAVYNGGAEASISGTVSGTVIRADGGTVTVSGGTISGNVASIVLPAAAYAIPGSISIAIKLVASGSTTTIGACTSYVYRTTTDTIVDPGHVIPSIEELLAKIAECEAATTAANAAASSANTAANNANTKANLADQKATAANTAANTANTAATSIDNMTVAAQAGSTAGAAISNVSGHKHILFTLPKGDPGAMPQIGIGNVSTGNPGTSAAVTITGTAASPLLNFTIPRGANGATGATPDFSIGTVTTGAAGTPASATITGTDEAPVLNLTIPQGADGDPAPSNLVVPAVDSWLSTNITNPSNPPLDRSLSSSSSAAPADLVGDQKTEITNTDKRFDGVEYIEYTKGKYINLAPDPTDTTMLSSVSYCCVLIPCSAGDTFVIAGTTGQAEDYRLWKFIDSSGYQQAQSRTSSTGVEEIIVAPANTAYLVSNARMANPHYLYKIVNASEYWKTEYNDGNYINYGGLAKEFSMRSNGEVYPYYDEYALSGMIDVSDTDYLYLNKGRRYCFFNSSKTFLSTGNLSTQDAVFEDMKIIPVPAGAKYFRIVYALSDVNDDLYIFKDPNTLMRYMASGGFGFLKGKKVCWYGDSISYGSGLTDVTDAYPYLVSTNLGMTLKNYAVGGSVIAKQSQEVAQQMGAGYYDDIVFSLDSWNSMTKDTSKKYLVLDDPTQSHPYRIYSYSNGSWTPTGAYTSVVNGRYPIVDVVKRTDSDADVIVIATAYNDFMYHWTPFGTMADRDRTTYYGALHTICQYLLANFPAKQFVFVSLFASRYQQSGTINADWTCDAPDDTNPLGKTIGDYANAVEEVCKYYGIPFIDLGKNIGFAQFQHPATYLQNDNLHWNVDGHARAASVLTPMFKNMRW